MKRYKGYFDAIGMFECVIAEPVKDGNRLSVTILHNLSIPPEHPLSVDGRGFYADGFAMVFDGVTRSERKLAHYGAGARKDEVVRTEMIDDGPFPESEGGTRTYFLEGLTPGHAAHIYEWEIDAMDFYLEEPAGPWERYQEIDVFRSGNTS